jgi:hypothetical protein
MWRLIMGEPHEPPASNAILVPGRGQGAHRRQFEYLHSGLAFVGPVPDLAAGRSCAPGVCSDRRLLNPTAVRSACHAGSPSYRIPRCVMALS